METQEYPDVIAIVGSFHMKVLVTNEGDHWIAQGLDMDYIAQGNTLEEVKKEFEDGMAATIHEYLKVGSVEKFFTPPEGMWEQAFADPSKIKMIKELSQVSIHRIPKPLTIQYMERAA